LKYRAIWAISHVTDQEGLKLEVVNQIFTLMHSNTELSVKVEAALCIAEIVSDQPQFASLIKPALEQLLGTYLNIMELIDCKELVEALQKIAETYHNDITPYAVAVAGKLSENYLKLVNSDKEDREDTEIMSTAIGCIHAINRILGLCIETENLPQDLFPLMEKALYQLCCYLISPEGSDEHLEDGLTTIS